MPEREPEGVNPLVEEILLRRAREVAGAAGEVGLTAPGDMAEGSDVPPLVVFAGFRGPEVTRSSDQSTWQILYIDLALTEWLLIEAQGIISWKQLDDQSISPLKRDLVWVDEDAVVGRGSRSLSPEAQFLTGEFTRAGDFEAPVRGGTTDGGGAGTFYETKSPTCCRYPSRPR